MPTPKYSNKFYCPPFSQLELAVAEQLLVNPNEEMLYIPYTWARNKQLIGKLIELDAINSPHTDFHREVYLTYPCVIAVCEKWNSHLNN